MIVISSASFDFTPTIFGVKPAREVDPLTDVCCFVVASPTTPPASPAHAVRPERYRNPYDLLVHLRAQRVRCHRRGYRGRRRRLQRVLRFLVL